MDKVAGPTIPEGIWRIEFVEHVCFEKAFALFFSDSRVQSDSNVYPSSVLFMQPLLVQMIASAKATCRFQAFCLHESV